MRSGLMSNGRSIPNQVHAGAHMSDADTRRGRKPYNGVVRTSVSEQGDEQGDYTQTQLIRMDNRFRAHLLRAFERGKESRASAAHAYIVPSKSRLPSAPLVRSSSAASSSAGVGCGFLARRFLAGFSSLRPSRLRTNS